MANETANATSTELKSYLPDIANKSVLVVVNGVER